ncbi:MAG: hypothetical protein JW993_15655 [Sedimentisphaerales bacterium]|nr:hypothetical protein [Sedimentisphaerales bacterium]
MQTVLLAALCPVLAFGQPISPSAYWKNQVTFPDDPFCARGISKDSARWVKFTLLLAPYDPNVVYFQDSRKYVFHYNFAVENLDPFAGMTSQQFNAVTLSAQNQQAILGTVVLPPLGEPGKAKFQQYGIQFVRQEPYSREQIRDMFELVKARIAAPPDVEAFYFPTFEQQAVAQTHRDWFEAQGIPLGSTGQWAEGNVCYSQGWALGTLKFIPAGSVDAAYQSGLLGPQDILLTDGIPAELPFVAGIVSLVPSTPNSHVAILARTQTVPFVYLALPGDADRAQELVGHRIVFSAYDDGYGGCDTRLIDTEGLLDEPLAAEILKLKLPKPLAIEPIAPYGALGLSTEGLLPGDVQYVGGKAANFGILREAIPESSPQAIGLTFDLWTAFLDQPFSAMNERLELAPGERILFWADEDESQGPTHAGIKLSKDGEYIALYAADGTTVIDSITFGLQQTDVSYGRGPDGGDAGQSLAPTPGRANTADAPVAGNGLVINEFMADNETTIEDPNEPGEYPDWIELYNASNETITLNGLYLTDRLDNPTKWRIAPFIAGPTLRDQIALLLAPHQTYPPSDMQRLSADLASIRSLFTTAQVTDFGDDLRAAVLDVLTTPEYGFDPNAPLRFRSSTNVEDSEDYTGAGLYDSFSGCLADDLDDDNDGPSACDPNRDSERSVFDAIRQVFASFFNDNAYLERLRRSVDESQVGMAVLVHHAFPDDLELANGVATVEIRDDGGNSTITLVTQQGAVSVTNPADASTPEEVVVTILPSGSIVPPRLMRSSSLIPLGGTVMTWRADYTTLTNLLLRVSDTFRETTGKTAYTLDLEYKKVAPGWVQTQDFASLPAGGIVVKQVREVPSPDRTPSIVPFLIDVPLELEVYSGEFELLGPTDAFADHRLKSRWRLTARNMTLDPNALSEGLFTAIHLEYLDEDRVGTVDEVLSFLPSASHAFDTGATLDTWRLTDLDNPRDYHLRATEIPTAVSAAQNPIFIPSDLGSYAFNLPYKCLTLDVEYDDPVSSWHQQLWATDLPSGLRTTTKNRVYLWSPPGPEPDDVFRERVFCADGITIRTSFYHPPAPEGYPNWTAHTAPLKRWDRTIIEGLTSEPIVLEGYYSQTYRPEHHNLIETFLFEPRLEPGLPATTLAELEASNIRLIHLTLDNQPGGTASSLTTYGFDN